MTDLCFVQSGSIVDGLAFFKKNVSSHFEGQSECAICYSYVSVVGVGHSSNINVVATSMISAMDGSLPKKPCRTCKNKFHAGCLYKVSALRVFCPSSTYSNRS